MLKPENQEDSTALQERVHRVYGRWAVEHADGQILTVRPYDPSEQYQKVEIARIEPEPSLEIATMLGRVGMGEIAYNKLLADLGENEVVDIAHHRHQRQQGTLISTLHLRDVFDTAMTHNGIYVASGGNPETSDINDVIVNPMLSRLTIGNQTVLKALATAGGIDIALPAEAAAEYGMETSDIEALGRLYSRTLRKRLNLGVIVHWSLPGTRGKPMITKDGEPATYVKRIKDGIAKIVSKKANWAVPIPMDVAFGDCKAEVLRPRQIKDTQDVHLMMEEMVEVASELASEKIFYGLPAGGRTVKIRA